MNVERVKANIEHELQKDHSFDEVHWGPSRREDDGRTRVFVDVGHTETESMIEADFHSTQFVAERSFMVMLSDDGDILDITEQER